MVGRAVLMVRKGLQAFASDDRAVIQSVIGLAVAIAVLIVIGLIAVFISATVSNVMQPELTSINDTQIRGIATGTVYNLWKGQDLFSKFVPIVIIVFIASIVISVLYVLMGRRGGEV